MSGNNSTSNNQSGNSHNILLMAKTDYFRSILYKFSFFIRFDPFCSKFHHFIQFNPIFLGFFYFWTTINKELFFLIPGAIFEQGTDEVQSAFKFAMLNHNLNVTSRRFELQAYVDVINTADAFKLSRLSK